MSGPDVKIRGTAMHIAEKYSSLARDAMSSGDTVAAENYLQHAEHYNRIILAAQAQNGGIPGLEGQLNGGGRFNQGEPFQRDYDGDGDGDEGDSDDYVPRQHQRPFQERPAYNQHQQPQPYIPQNAFPQIQPQPVVPAPAPAPNGLAPQGGGVSDPYSAPPQEGDRMPRRRRRRPIGEPPQLKTFNGRNGNGGASANGAPPEGADPKPDESSS